MRDMMDGGGMMWGMGIGWLIGAVVAVLVIGALVKYVFFR
jgi:ABC-type multidrug transport system permease subunit